MPFYIGENKIVDRYIGDKLVIAAYKGETKYFDAYSEITGSLPIIFKSRAAVALKNYLLHGTSEGAGVETENLLRSTTTESTRGGGITVSQTAGKSEFIVSKTATEADSSLTINVLAELTAGTYVISVDGLINHGVRNLDRVYIRDEDNNIITNNIQTNLPKGFTITKAIKVTKLAFVFASVAEYSNQVVRVMLTSGSTPPDHYIPHGYSIPLTITSGAQSQDVPIYIGSTKLGAEEYVDFGEQKVWKRTENLYPLSKKSFTVTRNDKTITITCDGTGAIYISGEASEISSASQEWASNFSFTLQAGTYYTGDIPSQSSFAQLARYIRKKSDNSVILQPGSSSFTLSEATEVFLAFYIYNGSGDVTWQACLTTTPSTYIPYLQPVDPPVLLPAISTYQGENTLSSTETLGEATIKGRINELPTQQSDN